MVANKIKGEMMDLQHGQAFLRTVKVNASTGKCCEVPRWSHAHRSPEFHA